MCCVTLVAVVCVSSFYTPPKHPDVLPRPAFVAQDVNASRPAFVTRDVDASRPLVYLWTAGTDCGVGNHAISYLGLALLAEFHGHDIVSVDELLDPLFLPPESSVDALRFAHAVRENIASRFSWMDIASSASPAIISGPDDNLSYFHRTTGPAHAPVDFARMPTGGRVPHLSMIASAPGSETWQKFLLQTFRRTGEWTRRVSRRLFRLRPDIVARGRALAVEACGSVACDIGVHVRRGRDSGDLYFSDAGDVEIQGFIESLCEFGRRSEKRNLTVFVATDAPRLRARIAAGFRDPACTGPDVTLHLATPPERIVKAEEPDGDRATARDEFAVLAHARTFFGTRLSTFSTAIALAREAIYDTSGFFLCSPSAARGRGSCTFTRNALAEVLALDPVPNPGFGFRIDTVRAQTKPSQFRVHMLRKVFAVVDDDVNDV